MLWCHLSRSLPQQSPPLRFSDRNCVRISHLSMRATCSVHLIPIDFIILSSAFTVKIIAEHSDSVLSFQIWWHRRICVFIFYFDMLSGISIIHPWIKGQEIWRFYSCGASKSHSNRQIQGKHHLISCILEKELPVSISLVKFEIIQTCRKESIVTGKNAPQIFIMKCISDVRSTEVSWLSKLRENLRTPINFSPTEIDIVTKLTSLQK
jgi:hypothetical protein